MKTMKTKWLVSAVKIAMLLMTIGIGLSAVAGNVTEPIAITKVQQRYPWNGLVDIELTNSLSNGGVVFLAAKEATTGEAITVKTLTLGDKPFTNGVSMVSNGTVHLVWDAKADVGEVMNHVNVLFSATVKDDVKYMVVDVSGGADAGSYPVSYLADVPTGGWTDEYKSKKIVLRRIKAGTFMMGSPNDEDGRYDRETQHQVTLTQDYWIGVFETTQKQYLYVMGENPSAHTGYNCPVESVSYDMIRGSTAWPSDNSVVSTSVMGRMRVKTGLLFDLPTEAQWEYSCRAGITGPFAGTGVPHEMGQYSGYAERHPSSVGICKPNDWGLYDMHGNVEEWCLDWYASYKSNAVTNPVGAASGSYRVLRGGSWLSPEDYCRSASRSLSSSDKTFKGHGFRFACAAESSVEVSFSLDLREGERLTRGEEMISWDAGWDGTDENATVKLSVNGTTLVNGETGAGTYAWRENKPGTYKFTHITYQDGKAVNRLTATFVREVLDFLETEIQVRGYEGDYDGEAHTITVTAPEGATVMYATDENGPWSATAPGATEVGSVRIWVRVSKEGWNDYVTSAVVTIRQLVTAHGVPFAWFEDQDLIFPSDGVTRVDYEEVAAEDLDEDGFAAWEEYVIGSDPWDETSKFKARIEMGADGKPIISWEPNLGTERKYTIEGRASLTEGDWEAADETKHRFFRVRVELK